MRRYNWSWEGMEVDHIYGQYVEFDDIIELQEEVEHLREYTDHLVKFSKLPCLPRDLENLRDANYKFAIENEQLKQEIEGWKNKWQCAILLAAKAENKIEAIKGYLNNTDEF